MWQTPDWLVDMREKLKDDPKSVYNRYPEMQRQRPVNPEAVKRMKAHFAQVENEMAEKKAKRLSWSEILTKEKCEEIAGKMREAGVTSINWATSPSNSGLPRPVAHGTLRRYFELHGIALDDNQGNVTNVPDVLSQMVGKPKESEKPRGGLPAMKVSSSSDAVMALNEICELLNHSSMNVSGVITVDLRCEIKL